MQIELDTMKKKEKFISQCCICKRVRRKEGFKFTGDKHKHMDEWDHHEEDLKYFHDVFDIMYSHGYCESCVQVLLEEFEKEIRNKSK